MQGMKQMTEEMQQMQQTMEKQEGMKEMAGKMEDMRKKFQKMHDGMMQEGMHGQTGAGMTCPMCGKMMGQMDQPHKVVNSRCPIMGTKLDVDRVPADLTREFKGQKIGFCCPSCPPAWDKLSDADKEAKLKQFMGEAAEQVKTQ